MFDRLNFAQGVKCLIAFILCIVISCSMFPVGTIFADAAEHEGVAVCNSQCGCLQETDGVCLGELPEDLLYSSTLKLPNSNPNASANAVTAMTGTDLLIYNTLYDGIKSFSSSIYLRNYAIPVANFRTYFREIMYTCPEFFYLDNSWSYYVSTINGVDCIASFVPNYTMTQSEYTEAFDYYDAEVKKIAAMCQSDWTDIEKLLFLNDYIAIRCTYDKNLYINEDLTIYDAYNMLKQNTGVCMAYQLTMMAVLNELGIDNSYATNTGHIWNVVKVDGEWYHLDITWNDPYVNTTDYLDYFGMLSHNYFLKSDTYFANDDYGTWSCGYVCSNTKYDNETLWSSSRSPFVITDEGWYYIDSTNRQLNLYNDITGSTSTVLDLGKWYVYGNSSSYWGTAFSGLSYYDGYLIYNTSTAIYAYDTESGATHLLASPDCAAGYVYGTYIKDDSVEYTVATDYMRATSSYGAVSADTTILKNITFTSNSSLSYDETTGYLSQIDKNNNSASAIAENFKNMSSKLVITSKNGTILGENDFVGTGASVDLIVYDEIVDTMTVLLENDIDGDGTVTVADAASIMQAVYGNTSIDGVYRDAADFDGNDKINILDVMATLNAIG